MYGENHYYGHSALLLRHCELPLGTVIPARLQHGWQVGAGMPLGPLREPGPKLLWGQRNLDAARAEGHTELMAIGAPFLYLPPVDVTPLDDRSLLVIPFHGWEREALEGSMVQYADAIETLVGEGFGPVTVCMYWFEYAQAALRSCFESRGFATTTMGHRDANPDFLVRQRELLLRHAFVTSNRVSTAAFYGLYSGRPFFLWGPPQGLSAGDDPTGEAFDRWQGETFPELAWDRFDGGCRQETGARELGLEFRRPPQALIEALALGPAHRWRRARLRVRKAVHTTRRKLGLLPALDTP